MSLDFCNFTVKVEDDNGCLGSGCLIQPVDRNYYYVLTAKHVIKERTKENIKVFRLLPDESQNATNSGNEGVSVDRFEVLEIYRHSSQSCDAAVLKVWYVQEPGAMELNAAGLNRLLLLNKEYLKADKTGYFLTGHPKARWWKKYSYRQNKTEISQIAGSGHIEVSIDGCPDFPAIEGQSGGGIIKKIKNNYYLAGILSQMAAEDSVEVAGRAEMMPVSFFEEIVKKQEDRFRNYVWDGKEIGKIGEGQQLKQLISELDRAPHSLVFASFLEQSMKEGKLKNPLVSIIWGRNADAPDVLVERLKNEIPKIMDDDNLEDSGIKISRFSEREIYKLAFEWEKFSEETYLNLILLALRREAGKGKVLSAKAFKEHLKDAKISHSPLIIYSKFDIKNNHIFKLFGTSKMLSDLRYFFKFWDEYWIKEDFAPERPVFIFLTLEYYLPEDDNKKSFIKSFFYNKEKLKKKIEEIEEHYNLQSVNLRVKVLPELKNIKSDEIVEFLEILEKKEEFSDSPRTIEKLIGSIKNLNINSEISFGDFRDRVILRNTE